MKNTIELNGNLYDAVSGKMLGTATGAPKAAPAITKKTAGTNMDGFFRTRSAAAAVPASQKIGVLATPHHPPKAAKAPRTMPNHARAHKPQVSQRVRTEASAPAKITTTVAVKSTHAAPPNHAKAHKPQAAVTLMRSAVKKPAASVKRQANVQSALAHSTPSLIPVKHTAAHVDADRLVRASAATKHAMVAHHGKQAPSPVQIAVAPLQVQPVPTPVKPKAQVPPAAPAPQPSNKPQDIFDHALANASNFVDVKQHRSHFRKHTRQHVASMAAGTLALFIIALFAVYQNSPGLQLRVASVQAGVSTHMPNFKAAGFAYGGVRAGSGRLTIGFSDGRGKYQLTQQPTNWSGSDMIQEVASTDASGRPNYTTVKAADGTTVYRLSDTNAMWVMDGKWYSINGSTTLSNDQVQAIVQHV